MPKNIPPQEGVRVFDLLDSLIRCSEDEKLLKGKFKLPCSISESSKASNHVGRRPEEMGYPFAEVRSGVNDTCCNNNQAALLVQHMNEVATQMPSTEKKVIPLIILANSFRWRCGDCFNGDCTHRDQAYPVEKVRERARQMGMDIDEK